MSTLAADVSFNLTFPPCDPVTPPSFTFDPSLLEIPYHPGHTRSSSRGSVFSFESSPSDSLASTGTRTTTPARSPIRTHGPLLLPRIRNQDQAIAESGAAAAAPAPKRARTTPSPAPAVVRPSFRPSHTRSFTNPEAITFSCSAPPVAASLAFPSHLSDDCDPTAPALLCSPVSFAPPHDVTSASHSRRASSCSVDNIAIEKYGFPTYRGMPTYVAAHTSSTAAASPPQAPQADTSLLYQPYVPRAPSPLAASASVTPEPTPMTTLLSFLASPNPAPSLVRTISFPLRDPHAKHFWWDVRQVRPWTGFNAATILSLPGAAGLLSCPVPAALLPAPAATPLRHPETEAALHSIYSSYYVPKLNAALALSSPQPLQLSSSAKSSHGSASTLDCMFAANIAGHSSSAATIFGGKPSARVVGVVKSFDRFNTGMRVEGNVKRVEYLRGLAHVHHVMREHGSRYGFILTEIELVIVRNGAEGTPHFGYLEVASVQLAAAAPPEGCYDGGAMAPPMTACLALWGLCMLAGDAPLSGHAHWRSDIGAPAEGSRRKALPRDDWMPQPQLAEKRESKRARGWVWPEDPIGRKELGKRGVRYGAC